MAFLVIINLYSIIQDFDPLRSFVSSVVYVIYFCSFKLDERHEFEDEDALAEDEGEKTGDNPATSGSRGTAYGGENELFQSQFQLHTVQQKLNQIVLLQVGQ